MERSNPALVRLVQMERQDVDPLGPFDVTLLDKEGKQFEAHRNVLSEASPFFEKLLQSDMKENKEGVRS